MFNPSCLKINLRYPIQKAEYSRSKHFEYLELCGIAEADCVKVLQ